VLPWISSSIHPGGVKWIIIFGKEFDRPRLMKRFLLFCNYVKELLWFWNQKFSCCIIQVCFCESTILKECLVMVSKAIQLYAISFLHIFVECRTIAYQNWNFFNFLCHPYVFRVCHLKSCLQHFLPWVDHEILDLLEDPSSPSHSLFPLVQLSNIGKWRNRSFMTSWINLFEKEDRHEINKTVED
jgi:hypothetical protein